MPLPGESMRAVMDAIGYAFRDESLLSVALTHSSWVNEQGGGALRHNERLEFLGDAVFELLVTERLFTLFPDAREGDLTRLRSSLVSTVSFAAIARRIGLADSLRMGRGEEQQGGRDRDPLLADALEAVLGAVYLDGGLPAARGVVGRLFEDRWPAAAIMPVKKDYKTRLQECTQRLKGASRGLPVYAQAEPSGEEHAPHFTAEVTLPDGRRFTGEGQSRRASEQMAARQALEALGALDERADAQEKTAVLRGSKKSGIYHFPGCRCYHAAGNDVEFRSKEEAEKKGFRPCRVCSPR
ncbi:MAG: ribonuclease III [Desulfovibrionaceae bacterium]|nr:ribonuclease III [Desulfovibrionaceae bacterium]